MKETVNPSRVENDFLNVVKLSPDFELVKYVGSQFSRVEPEQ